MAGAINRIVQGILPGMLHTDGPGGVSGGDFCGVHDIGTRSSSVSLVRMALRRLSKAIENETNARTELFSGNLMVIYWMLSGM